MSRSFNSICLGLETDMLRKDLNINLFKNPATTLGNIIHKLIAKSDRKPSCPL